MTLKALIFDFDDTLVESERLNDTLLGVFLSRERGISLTPQDEEVAYQYSWKEVFSYLGEKYGFHEPWGDLWDRFFAEKRRYLAGHRLRVARGARSILSLPLPKAIVSGSAREEIELMLASAGLAREAFAAVVSADDCQRNKPDPEGFLRALGALAVTPQEALVFEDSPVGIEAAKRGAIPVAFVREFARQDLCGAADLCFDSLEEAFPWVKGKIEEAGREGQRG